MSASGVLYSKLLYFQQFGFCQVASAAVLIYDYLLLFGSEVDLIWARKWNLVTFLYAIVRYSSIFLILDCIFYTNNLTWSANVSLAWYEARTWVWYIFRTAMDIIMMKRIYVLSQAVPSRFLSSSRWVVATMAIAFVVKNVLSITMSLLALGPGSHLIYHEHEIANIHVCGILVPKANIMVSAQIPILAFELLIFGFALTYFIAHVWGFWRANKSRAWKVGDFLQIMVRDSTVYFAIIAAATALNYGNLRASGPTVYAPLSLALQNFLPFCFAPRLVINVMEHENKIHQNDISGEELSTLVFNEGRLTQGTNQIEDAV